MFFQADSWDSGLFKLLKICPDSLKQLGRDSVIWKYRKPQQVTTGHIRLLLVSGCWEEENTTVLSSFTEIIFGLDFFFFTVTVSIFSYRLNSGEITSKQTGTRTGKYQY